MRNEPEPGLPEVESIDTQELVTPCVEPETASTMDIYLSLEAYRVIAEHVVSDLEREVTGLLLGNFWKEAGRLKVTIAQALRGRETLSTSASVQLSYESWKHFIEEKASCYPDLATVGWYHTHPGFGTFLSSMDELVHEHFFGKRWQVALVVDPILGHWTFFRHQPDGIGRCERFLLIVPDNSSPDLGGKRPVARSAEDRKAKPRGLSGLLHSLRPSALPPSGDSARSEWLIDAPDLEIGDCHPVVHWSKAPLHVAAAGRTVYWLPSAQILRAANGESSPTEHPLPRFVDAIVPSPDGKIVYLLALDQAEIWMLHPDGTRPLRSFPIESDEANEADLGEYTFDPLKDRCRMAHLDNERLGVCTASELVVLGHNAEPGGYRVEYRRQVPRRVSLVLNPLRPMPLTQDGDILIPDLLRDRLICCDPHGERDRYISLANSPLHTPSDVTVARRQLVICDSGQERIVVSSPQGEMRRVFRLREDIRRRFIGLLGTAEIAYLVLTDGVWRCDRLLHDRE